MGLGQVDRDTGFRDVSPFAFGEVDPAPKAAPEPEAKEDQSERVSPEEEAYMRGFAEGHAQAKRAGDDAVTQEQARYRELRMAFRALDAAAMEALASDLSATVQALCEQVVGEYALDGAALEKRCEAAARRLGAGPRDLTLTLHPENRAQLSADAFPGWRVEEDAAMAPGALRLTSADGAVREGPDDWRRAFAQALAS